jgi:hypothetical protein
LAVSGCATPHRLPAVPLAEITEANPGIENIRYLVSRDAHMTAFATEYLNSLHKEEAILASQGHSGPLPPASMLAISGGGDDGAYGAGFLTGWTAAGTRPNFKVVTGVSTGALISPFAFMGPKYDYVLARVYTETSQKDIFKKRSLIKGIFGDAMADTTPLARVIATYIDQPFLDAVAAEYAKGRLLLVGTTNMDTLEPVIWNMTAIAATKSPRALPLFRSVLLASASIPGAFPPVMINVDVNGKPYQEMHSDGGTVAQVFIYPPSFSVRDFGPNEARKRTLYVMRNARLDPDWASTERRTLPIAARAITSLTRTQGIGDLIRIYLTSQRDGIDYNLTYIPATFNVPHKEEFDTSYMRQLFAVGKQLAESGYVWQKVPPGYEGNKIPLKAAGK